jgi:hypothetical protein
VFFVLVPRINGCPIGQWQGKIRKQYRFIPRGSAKPVVNFTERRTRGLVQRCEAGNPVREMAKVCALSAPGFLLGVFFGFGGFFFRLLCVVVIGGRPDGGEATAA